MNEYFIAWTLLALVFLFFEMSSPGLFYFLSFSFGALAAGAISLQYSSFYIQGGTFLLVTCFTLWRLKSWIARKENKQSRSNIYALQGTKGVVTKDITTTNPGAVKLGGEVWSAKVTRNEILRCGDIVRVVSVKGAHVVVEKSPPAHKASA